MSRISNLDYLRKVLSGTLSATNQSPFNFPFPIMETLGFRLVEVGEGTASMEMETKTDVRRDALGIAESSRIFARQACAFDETQARL